MSKLQIPRTLAVPRVKWLLNERPEGMDYEKYREVRREQTKWLKGRLRGVFAWKSKGGENWGTATRERIPIVVLR